MHKMPTVERVLFGFGLLLVLIAVDLFWVHPQALYGFFGIEDGGARTAIAKVELTKEDVRRKFYDRNEFISLSERQTIYAKDQVMTGPNGFLVLTFPNGSVIELHGDTLVEIQMGSDNGLGNQEMVLDVKKGEVAGTAAVGAQLKVVSKGKKVELKAPPPTSVSQYLLHPEVVKEKPKACKLDEPRYRFMGGTPDGVQVTIGMTCEGAATQIPVSIKNASGQSVLESEVMISPRRDGEISFIAREPGRYHASTKQEVPGILDFEVPKALIVTDWVNPPISCDGSLRWIVPNVLFTKTQLLDARGTVLWSQEGSKPIAQANVKSKVPLMTDVSVSFMAKSGFDYRTPYYRITAWRECPTLRNPMNHSKAKRDEKGEILFSWSDLPGQRHYIFELTNDPSFQKVLISSQIDINFHKTKVPGKGRYFWRVRMGNDVSEVSDLLVE